MSVQSPRIDKTIPKGAVKNKSQCDREPYESGSYVNNVQRFMLDPDDVAWQVVHFFGSNRRELNLPLSLATLAKLYQIFPRIGDWASLKFASRK